MDIQREETRERNQEKACPEGWLPAGAKVPIRLTIRQEDDCRRAEGVRRFCHNLYAVID